MADVSAQSISPDVPQGLSTDPPATPVEAPSAPEEPEITSETLYIQNLNERIKIDGHSHSGVTIILRLTNIFDSAQSLSAWIIQVIWRSFGCGRS